MRVRIGVLVLSILLSQIPVDVYAQTKTIKPPPASIYEQFPIKDVKPIPSTEQDLDEENPNRARNAYSYFKQNKKYPCYNDGTPDHYKYDAYGKNIGKVPGKPGINILNQGVKNRILQLQKKLAAKKLLLNVSPTSNVISTETKELLCKSKDPELCRIAIAGEICRADIKCTENGSSTTSILVHSGTQLGVHKVGEYALVEGIERATLAEAIPLIARAGPFIEVAAFAYLVYEIAHITHELTSTDCDKADFYNNSFMLIECQANFDDMLNICEFYKGKSEDAVIKAQNEALKHVDLILDKVNIEIKDPVKVEKISEVYKKYIPEDYHAPTDSMNPWAKSLRN